MGRALSDTMASRRLLDKPRVAGEIGRIKAIDEAEAPTAAPRGPGGRSAGRDARGDSMRRLLMLSISGALILALGCTQRYEKRMDQTITELKYERELNKYLDPAPAEGKLKELDIYVRPPKGLVASKEFLLPGVQPGQFDVERTFHEGTKSLLHVLARKKMAKKAPAKGAPAEPPVARGDFNSDVLKALKEAFGDDENIALEKFKDDPHKANKFRRAIFTSNGKKVEVFLTKVDPYDVAIIYVFDPADDKVIEPKIRYSLEAFALGDKAKNKYAGTSEAEAEAATLEPQPTTF